MITAWYFLDAACVYFQPTVRLFDYFRTYFTLNFTTLAMQTRSYRNQL